jgi:hypothetical protein
MVTSSSTDWELGVEDVGDMVVMGREELWLGTPMKCHYKCLHF